MTTTDKPTEPPTQTPATSFVKTPEFRAAVAQAASEAVAGLMIKLEAGQKAAGADGEKTDRSFIGSLALELAQLSGQGSGRKYVAPEIMRSRTLARERMTQLIIDARSRQAPATYELRNKVMLDNQLIEPMWIDSSHITHPTQIDYPNVPNEAMIPVNETAKAIFGAFMESIGSTDQVVSREDLGITPGGLVVRNGAVNATAARRAVVGGDQPAADGVEGVRVHHTDKPGRYIEKHILGTIAAPARQSA